MSDATKALELMEDVNSNVKNMQNRIVKLEGDKSISPEDATSMKEAIGNLEKANEKKDEEYEKLIKSIDVEKAKTKAMSGVDSSEHKRAQCVEFAKSLRDLGGMNPRIAGFNTADFKSSKDLMESKNYNSFDDSLGGVTVIPFLDSMIDKLVRELSPIRSMASVSTISTDKWEQLKMNQTNGALWEKDMSNFTAQTKENDFDKLSIFVQNLHSIAIFSDDLINDSAFNIVGEILQSIAEDYALTEGISYWTGDGVGEMSGVLNAPAVGSGKGGFDEIERINGTTSLKWKFEDVYNLIYALKLPYVNGAEFKANRLGIAELRKLRSDSGAGAGTGDFLWQPSGIAGQPATIAGFPITQAPELSATPLVAGIEGLVFGNFRKAYKIVDRMGVAVLRDNLTGYPNIAYKSKKRMGGGVSKGEALKILKTIA
ncbi:MAG TPA: phage major capsid protein [Flavobacteriales bacterium]|nr:phage major capsid protein [Flavobacteriales bacterium]